MLDSISVKGTRLVPAAEAFVDSGYDFIEVPRGLAKQYYDRTIKGRYSDLLDGTFEARCSEFDALEDLTVTVGHKTYVVPKDRLRLPVLDDSGQPTGQCVGAVSEGKP